MKQDQKEMRVLTEGPIVSTLLSLALPIMASSFLATAYNIMDMAWVGTLGAKAVAGVGIGGMYIWFSQGVANLPRMGGQVLTAQSIGSGRMEDAKRYTRAAVQIVVVLGMLFSVICLVFTPQLVDFFKLTDEESIGVALSYTRITCGLIIFSFLNVTMAGLYTAMGDSKTPLRANVCGLGLNMILDPLLILGVGVFPALGANGAAIATVISQAVVTSILFIRTVLSGVKGSIFQEQSFFEPVSTDFYKNIVRIGLPVSVQSTAYCFISMILTRFVSGFGAEALAAFRVGGQIEAVSWNTADGFGSALNAFCGQNYGANRFDRIKKGYRFSLLVTIAWGMLVLACFVGFPRTIASVFVHEESAIRVFMTYLIIVGLSEPFMVAELVTGGALAGLGKTKLGSMLSITLTGVRIPLAFVLEGTKLGLKGIWWTIALTTIVKGVVFSLTFTGIVRKATKKT